MATTNYNFDLPVVGSDFDSWGGLLNGNWSALDTALKAVSDKADAALPEAQFIRKTIDLIYPVNSIYLTMATVNPATFLPGTTWEKIAEGRALVGVGFADGETWQVGDEKGTARHTLTTNQLPSHSHAISSAGAHTHDLAEAGFAQFNTIGAENPASIFTFESGNVNLSDGPATNRRINTEDASRPDTEVRFPAHTHTMTQAGGHTHTVTAAGGGASHNNIQPSFAVNIWRRVA